jgi:hypothetical protein
MFPYLIIDMYPWYGMKIHVENIRQEACFHNHILFSTLCKCLTHSVPIVATATPASTFYQYQNRLALS